MTTGDILTQQDWDKIIVQLVEGAGPGGIAEDALLSLAEVAAAEIRELKIHAGLYEGFTTDRLRISVNDGEVLYSPAGRPASRTY